MRKDFDIVGSFNKQRYPNVDSERTLNMFEYIDAHGKKPKALFPTSGLQDTGIQFGTEQTGFRAQFTFMSNGIMNVYSVVGRNIYISNNSPAASLIGTLNTSSGYVGIDANTYQIIFVDGVNGFIWDTIAQTMVPITDTSFPIKPIDVCYLDGFFVVANGDTNTFQLSSFNQGLVWGNGTDTFTANAGTDLITVPSTENYQTGIPITVSTAGTLPNPLVAGVTYYVIKISATTIKLATSYANAIASITIDLTTNGVPVNTITNNGQLQQGAITAHPGTIVGCDTLHRRLFLFSQNFTEVWENAGAGTNLPFRRNNAYLLEVGTPSVGSIAVGFDRMFFLSQDKDGLGAVVEVVGTQSVPVSTEALDFVLASYAADQNLGVGDARGILVKENGIIFYRINFTKANHTWVFNVSMSDPQNKRWHEEEVLNGDRHPAQTHVFFNGVNYYGSYNKPILYAVSPSYSTNNGEAIRRMRIGRPQIDPEYNRIRIDRFHLDLRQGDMQALGQIVNDASLLTESDLEILTEAGLTIELDQAIFVPDLSVLLPDPHSPGHYTVINPTVLLSISKNGGQSFGALIRAPMGKLGEYTFRTVWRKLGTVPRGQAFIPKIEFFYQFPFVILGAAWDFEILPE